MKWEDEIAEKLGSRHSDTQALIRSGKKGAKQRTNRLRRRRQRAQERRANGTKACDI